MSEFEDESAALSASYSLELDGENMMNEENMRDLEETRSESKNLRVFGE